MSRKIVVSAAVMAVMGFLALGLPGPASAATCIGTVHGLSKYYNPATGSGFLAVRVRPNSGARMVGQLFNGDRVRIFDRQGSWYRVGGNGVQGWAYRKWLWNSCNY